MADGLTYSFVKDQFAKAVEGFYSPIAKAATGAIGAAAGNIKRDGRANIAAAGFSKNWQNAFRVNTYPRAGVASADASALIFHKIPYADVFQQGATIRGKPVLWVPLPGTPKKIGSKRISPKLFAERIGPLFTLPGHTNLLFANIERGKRARQTNAKIPLYRLIAGAKGGKGTMPVPLFVALDTVKLRKRFDLVEITRREAGRLRQYYDQAYRKL